MNEDDALATRLADLSAQKLEAHCAEAAVSSPNEQRHLAPQCKLAAIEVAATCHLAPELDPFGFGPKLGWTGLGNVDVVFRWPDRGAMFVELKCGGDLSPCAWDAVKLAAGVLHGNAESAYLLAGAPTAAWKQPARGTELFVDKQWETLSPEIRDAYRDWWYRWQEEVPGRHIPGLVAETFETTALGSWQLSVGSHPWELRLARIRPVGDVSKRWCCVCPAHAV